MRKPHSYWVWTDRESDKGIVERDGCQCPHCGMHFIVRSRATPAELGRFCTSCMAQCCTKPGCNGPCVHFMQQIEQMEARGRLLASVGL